MNSKLPYTALVSPNDLLNVDGISKIRLPLVGPAQEGLYSIMSDVSRQIETSDMGVGRFLAVRKHTFRIRRDLWYWDEEEGAYVAYARQWPVVQVLTSGVEILVAPDDKEGASMLKASSPVYKVDVVTGYRREDQDIEIDDPNNQGYLPTGSEEALEGLTEQPPVLPGDIRRVALNLVIFNLNVIQNNLIGLSNKEVDFGRANVKIERADNKYVEGQLQQLSPYKYHSFA